MLPGPIPDHLAERLAVVFAVDREIGRGGMGIVYLARDLALDRPVALKVLPAAAAHDATVRQRFLREARTAARLSHPHIVPVYRAEERDGIAYFAMGWVDGESLGARLRARGPLPAADVVRWLREVAWALAYAHARGVVHRDVKPENVLVERATGRAMVTDFGVARDAEQAAAEALTVDGHVLGTVHYMSPEQVQGEPLDGRSDLYALGVVAYQLLSGHLPFDAPSPAAVLVAHVTRPAPPLRSVAPHVGASLAAVVDRCLAKAPDDRPASGEALADALGRALEEDARAAAASPAATAEPVLAEEDAARLWRRAAQLQAEAASRLEVAALRVPGAHDGAGDTDVARGRYALRQVEAAAEEAGISRAYVAQALAELRGGGGALGADGAAVAPAPAGWVARVAPRLLGTRDWSCATSAVLRGAPDQVLEQVSEHLAASPWSLALRDVVGPHPLDGGVLVYRLPGDTARLQTQFFQAGFPGGAWYWLRQALEAEEVHVSVRPVPGQGDATEVVLRSDLTPGVLPNARVGAGLTGVAAVLGAVGGGAAALAALQAGGAVSARATQLGAAAGALAGGAGAGGGAWAFFRGMYAYSRRRAERELAHALGALESALGARRLRAALRAPRAPTTERTPPDGVLGPGRRGTPVAPNA
jgi:hypothetical protein